MFFFGIDWSSDHHDLCILNAAGSGVSQLTFPHTEAGFAQVEAERRKLGVPPQECLVAIESAYNLLVDFLLEHSYAVYIIPPQATDAYRNRQRSSGAHTDRSDAALLASILRTDRASHRLLHPNTPLTQQLAVQVRLIETLRRAIQRQENQLYAVLQRVYPQALGLFGDLTAQISLEFLSAYPTAQEAQALSQEAFTAFCQAQHYTHPRLIPQRYAHLSAPAPQSNPTLAQAYREQVRLLATLLLPQVQGWRAAQARLTQLFRQHPDHEIFASLPGAGDLLAPALLVKFGDHRDRFPTPATVQALAGTCPVTEHSGKRRLVKFRHGCDKEFRRITQQFARASLPQATWATAYWHEIRPRCTSDSHAYRILANRWLAIIWKLWQDHKPYDEAYHLQQRARRRQPKTDVER